MRKLMKIFTQTKGLKMKILLMKYWLNLDLKQNSKMKKWMMKYITIRESFVIIFERKTNVGIFYLVKIQPTKEGF